MIADPQVRYVGTIGGNVANGDPGNDMPAVMLCLGRELSSNGPWWRAPHSAREFYQGAYFTALETPGEIITAIRIPAPPSGHGSAYERAQSAKIGDYATAAAAVLLTISNGKVATCSIGLTNVAETPLWAEEAAQILIGSGFDAASVKKSRSRRRSHHLTGHRQSRTGPLPHQDGGRHGRSRFRARQRARPQLSRKENPDGEIPGFRDRERRDGREHWSSPEPCSSISCASS